MNEAVLVASSTNKLHHKCLLGIVLGLCASRAEAVHPRLYSLPELMSLADSVCEIEIVSVATVTTDFGTNPNLVNAMRGNNNLRVNFREKRRLIDITGQPDSSAEDFTFESVPLPVEHRTAGKRFVAFLRRDCGSIVSCATSSQPESSLFPITTNGHVEVPATVRGACREDRSSELRIGELLEAVSNVQQNRSRQVFDAMAIYFEQSSPPCTIGVWLTFVANALPEQLMKTCGIPDAEGRLLYEIGSRGRSTSIDLLSVERAMSGSDYDRRGVFRISGDWNSGRFNVQSIVDRRTNEEFMLFPNGSQDRGAP